MNSINNYFNEVGKEVNLDLTTMDYIKRVKRVTDRLDIEKNCKKVLKQSISPNLVELIKSVKNMNQKVNMLDVDYMKDVFFYKAKNDNAMAENP